MPTKGVRVRPSPDFFARYLCTVGWGIDDDGANPDSHYISLFNNTTDGAYLFVYGIDASFEFSYWAELFWVVGTLGDHQIDATRINPLLGAPPGAVYEYDLPHNTPLDGTPFTVLGNVVGSLPINQFPLAIVPPNYSLVVGPNKGDGMGDQSCGFWFIPFMDQSGTRPR